MIAPEINMVGVFVKEGTKDTWLQTQSGGRVSVLGPQPEELNIEDIAHALSLQCRYAGHCKEFYSVAQHCVVGAEVALSHFDSKELAKEVLLHDAAEAYIGDLIRPVKAQCSVYYEIEAGFEAAMSKRFGVNYPMSSDCKRVDEIMLTWEKRDLLPNSEDWPFLPDITDYNFPTLRPLSWIEAKKAYLEAYDTLFNES